MKNEKLENFTVEEFVGICQKQTRSTQLFPLITKKNASLFKKKNSELFRTSAGLFTRNHIKLFWDFLISPQNNKKSSTSKSKELFTYRIKIVCENKQLIESKDLLYHHSDIYLPYFVEVRGEKIFKKFLCNDDTGQSWTYYITKSKTYFSSQDLLDEYSNLPLPNYCLGEDINYLSAKQKELIYKFMEKYGAEGFVPEGWDIYKGFAYFRSYFMTALLINAHLPDFRVRSNKKILLEHQHVLVDLNGYRTEIRSWIESAKKQLVRMSKPPYDIVVGYSSPLAFLYYLAFVIGMKWRQCPICNLWFKTKSRIQVCCSPLHAGREKKRNQRLKNSRYPKKLL